MKYKGKIIQIIKEEESKKFGVKKENCDWLNIRPNPDFKHTATNWFMALMVVGLGLAFILDSFIGKWSGLSILISIGIGWYLIYKQDKYNKTLNNGEYWYFNSLIPIEKPHNFKLNDFVEIDLKIK